MQLNPKETVWRLFIQVRKFSLQVDVYRSDSFYATLALLLAAGMNDDGSYFQIPVLEMVSQKHDFLTKALPVSLLVEMSSLPG